MTRWLRCDAESSSPKLYSSRAAQQREDNQVGQASEGHVQVEVEVVQEGRNGRLILWLCLTGVVAPDQIVVLVVIVTTNTHTHRERERRTDRGSQYERGLG